MVFRLGVTMRLCVTMVLIAVLSWGCADEDTKGPVADIGQIGDDATLISDSAGVTPDTELPDGASDGQIPPEDGVTDTETSPEDVTAADTAPEPDTATEPPPFYLGGDRPAAYHMPFDYDGATPVPMLIGLHGYGHNAGGFESYFDLGAATKASGVMLVVPQGTTNPGGSNFWNATDACCNFYNSPVDDVAYLSELIAEAQLYFNIDPKRVYLTGHSNGGFMSYRMACERSELIAGIVNFAGATWNDPADCGDPGNVSILHVHGVFDTVIPYGGLISNDGLPAAQVPTVGECLEGSCTEGFDACQDDAGCKTYYNCLVTCSQQANPNPCYEGCWAASTPATKLLWMPVYTCGISLGCYGDWTKAWPGYPSAPKAVARWAERNGCSDETQEGPTLDLIADFDSADTVSEKYLGCPEGVDTELWSIVYGAHSPSWSDNWNNAIVDWLLKQHKP